MGITRKALLGLLLLIIILPTVQAIDVIQREEPKQTSQFGAFDGILGFVGSYWLFFVVAGGGIFVMIFVMKWWKTAKERDNVFLRDYNRTIQLCKLQANRKRVKERAVWAFVFGTSLFGSVMLMVVALVLDDTSIFMTSVGIFSVGIIASAFLKFTKLFAYHDIVQVIGQFGAKIIGYYMGDCITSDGYRNFLLFNGRKFLFWKNSFIVKVNMNEIVKIETKENNNRVIKEYALPKDLIVEGENLIAIKGEGLDKSGYFFYPLIADENGNIVNMDLIAYTRSRDVAILDTLYQQTEDFANVQRSAINMNPNVRYRLKTGGDTIGQTGGDQQ